MGFNSVFKGLNCLILEDGTDRSFRNVCNKLPIKAAQYPERPKIWGAKFQLCLRV